MLSLNPATPWLGLFGELDQGIPGEHLDRLVEALDAATDTAYEIVRYPGADHGLHCDGRPAVYNSDAAAGGWRRCVDWFDAHVG